MNDFKKYTGRMKAKSVCDSQESVKGRVWQYVGLCAQTEVLSDR